MKRICERGLNWFQIYDYKGNVRQCSWTKDGKIGNLQDNTVYEIYHSDAAEKIRNRLINGDYSQCNVDACPYLAMNELDKHMVEYENLQEYPTELYLGFERVCNYACTCCTVHKCMREEENKNLEAYYAKIEERIQPLLPHLKKISANGCGELFCSKHTLNILANWKPLATPENVEVILESNGSLFDEQHWKQIENLGKYKLHVAISVMSFEEPVYKYLSGTNLPISKLENNLKFIRSLREKEIINCFEIATVVQEQNFRAIPSFVKKCIEEYNPDYIRLRPYESWGAQSEEEVWLTDIRNPEHPYYGEYKKMMTDPILKHPLVHDWSGGLDTVKRQLFPYKVDNYKIRIITELLNNTDFMIRYIQTYINDKKIVVYGIATVGQIITQKLLENGFQIPYILDKYSDKTSYKGIPIVSLDEVGMNKKNELVVITPIVNSEEINADLVNRGFSLTIHIRDLIEDAILKSELKGI